MLYEAQATAIGGRTGAAATPDGRMRVTLTTPKELGGTDGPGTNPEQLLALGYAACFLETIRLVAVQHGIGIAIDSNVTATIRLGRRADDDGFGLEMALLADLPGVEEQAAEELLQHARIICPFSHAIGSHPGLRLTLT
ncbi:Ohr family peroxiredoxin [Roseomonas nepalensis]|uniref:Ohr family peroxiredoxin n=1 Tax=Muricoccus nepalensis TaxID=1854500 RepID=A0A502F9R4_9PROT|nr:Ohr family peroxiredoxin [Roseomonas nepalensis]